MRSSCPWLLGLYALTVLLLSPPLEAMDQETLSSSGPVTHGHLSALPIHSLLQPIGLWDPTYQRALTQSLLHRFYGFSLTSLNEQCQALKQRGIKPVDRLIREARVDVNRMVRLLCSLQDKDHEHKHENYLDHLFCNYKDLDEVRNLILRLRTMMALGALDKSLDDRFIMELKSALIGRYVAYDELVNPFYSYFTSPGHSMRPLGAFSDGNRDIDTLNSVKSQRRMDEMMDRFVVVLTEAKIAIDDRPLLAFHQRPKSKTSNPRPEEDPLNRLARGKDLSQFPFKNHILPQLGLLETSLCTKPEEMTSCLSKIHITIISHWAKRMDRWVQFLIHLLTDLTAPEATMIQKSLLGLQEHFSSMIKGSVSASLRFVLDRFHEELNSSSSPRVVLKTPDLLKKKLLTVLENFIDRYHLDTLLVMTINELKSMTGRALQLIFKEDWRLLPDPASLISSAPSIFPLMKRRLEKSLQLMKATYAPRLPNLISFMPALLDSLASFLDAYIKTIKWIRIEIWHERVKEAKATVDTAVRSGSPPHTRSLIKAFNDPAQFGQLLSLDKSPELVEAYLILQSIRSTLSSVSQELAHAPSMVLSSKQARSLSHALARMLVLTQGDYVSHSFSKDVLEACEKAIHFLQRIHLDNEDEENAGKVLSIRTRNGLLSTVKYASILLSKVKLLPKAYTLAMTSPLANTLPQQRL
ncbi:MAG: hypothetical protein DHS80DRAFT_26347 [Piptocephalis tieghemiana]|nr:MAG: hypothetical protein DHS80DRAFT_26347 [Piptocephalis tieghemiana]